MDKVVTYTISAGRMRKNTSVVHFTQKFNLSIQHRNIASNGSDKDYRIISTLNNGICLPVTNYCPENEYEKGKPLLKKYYKKENTFIDGDYTFTGFTKYDILKESKSRSTGYQIYHQ